MPGFDGSIDVCGDVVNVNIVNSRNGVGELVAVCRMMGPCSCVVAMDILSNVINPLLNQI